MQFSCLMRVFTEYKDWFSPPEEIIVIQPRAVKNDKQVEKKKVFYEIPKPKTCRSVHYSAYTLF